MEGHVLKVLSREINLWTATEGRKEITSDNGISRSSNTSDGSDSPDRP